MNPLSSRSVHIALSVLLFATIGSVYIRTRTAAAPAPRVIPSEGVGVNDLGGKVPGNPSRALQAGKHLYECLTIYRQRYGGQYPPSATEFTKDLILHSGEYPYQERSFSNPDTQYADDAGARNNPVSYFPWIISSRRPDGSLVGGPKPAATRDVLAYCPIYFHQDLRYLKGHRAMTNPSGFFVVVWDDGAIQEVSYSAEMFVPAGHGEYSYAFRGQAGIPSGARSYADFAKNVAGKPPSD